MIVGHGAQACNQRRIEIGTINTDQFTSNLSLCDHEHMQILFVGDIVGKPGRQCLRQALPILVKQYGVDIVVANVENAAGGMGVTRKIAETIRDMGVDVMTSGNHIWDKKEALSYIDLEPRMIRPANYPDAPGFGHYVARTQTGVTLGVINLLGRVFMNPLDNPFQVVRRELEHVRESEKVAMGWHLDGDVTAVVGTHTHVQTADERVLPNGTAYITDVGMTGPHDSVIGVDTRPALARFVNGMPSRFETASANPRLNGVVITANPTTGRAEAIERVNLATTALATPTSIAVSCS